MTNSLFEKTKFSIGDKVRINKEKYVGIMCKDVYEGVIVRIDNRLMFPITVFFSPEEVFEWVFDEEELILLEEEKDEEYEAMFV